MEAEAKTSSKRTPSSRYACVLTPAPSGSIPLAQQPAASSFDACFRYGVRGITATLARCRRRAAVVFRPRCLAVVQTCFHVVASGQWPYSLSMALVGRGRGLIIRCSLTRDEDFEQFSPQPRQRRLRCSQFLLSVLLQWQASGRGMLQFWLFASMCLPGGIKPAESEKCFCIGQKALAEFTTIISWLATVEASLLCGCAVSGTDRP